MKAIVLHVPGPRAAWWKETLGALLPETRVHLWDDSFTPSDIEVAVVWKHPPGGLLRFANLKAIVSIGAGVDHVLADPELPSEVALIRTTGEDLTQRMREYVALHVLRLHRRSPEMEAAQTRREWWRQVVPPASARRVGIMGLGNLGGECARALASLGFDVAGWSRNPKAIDGVVGFAGDAALPAFLRRSEILVCLLPLTPETTDILGGGLFAQLPEGAGLINCGRGEHLVEADLIPALDAGQLGHAVLDVFRAEPLPADHPFWTHPKITVTPHIASLIDPAAGGRLIAENLRKFFAGAPVADLVDLSRGY